jgi:Fur family ferric uptake transcriptional regulator
MRFLYHEPVAASRNAGSFSRRTEQRAAIREVLEGADGPLSAPEVLDAAKDRVPALGIATVYRNLRALADEGWLDAVDLPGEATRFERAGRAHHHHFHCEACGRVFDVGGCDPGIDTRMPRGFRVARHELVLYGRCPDC